MQVRILNGNCLDLMNKIDDCSIDFIFTDLPFGTTQSEWDEIIPLNLMWNGYKRIIKPNGRILLFSDEPFTSKLILSNLEYFKYRITWDKVTKKGFLNAKKMLLKQVEDIVLFSPAANGSYTFNPILYKKDKDLIRIKKQYKATKQTCYGKTNGGINTADNTLGYPSNLLSFNAMDNECNSGEFGKRLHVNQKPVEMLRYLIQTFSNENDTILDSTMGSGSTGEAAILENRNFIGMELSENIFLTAKQRLEKVIHSENQKLFRKSLVEFYCS